VYICIWGACANKQNESRTVVAHHIQRHSKTATNMLVVNLNLIHTVHRFKHGNSSFVPYRHNHSHTFTVS
jgi:hypothetical protein